MPLSRFPRVVASPRATRIIASTVVFGGIGTLWIVLWVCGLAGGKPTHRDALPLLAATVNILAGIVDISALDLPYVGRRRRIIWATAIVTNIIIFILEQNRYSDVYVS